MGVLDGRRCLVTGAASGIGRVFCEALAAEGAHVAGLDVLPVEADGIWVVADVTVPTQVEAAVSRAIAELDGLDVLVNNAGIYPSVPFEHTSYELWQRI